jgi:aspartate aminotransferase
MQHVVQHLQGVTIDMGHMSASGPRCVITRRDGVPARHPQGGFYLFPRTPIADDVAFVQTLLQRRILTVPGKGFGTPGYFRIAYCVEDQTIAAALDGFRDALREHAK